MKLKLDFEFKPEPEAEVLKSGDIQLIPANIKDHKDLLLKFAMGDRYNQTPESHLEKGLELVKHFWVGKADGVIGGVLMLCYLEHMDWWTLDAYKNNEHDNRSGDFSYRAGDLIVEWFFKNYPDVKDIYTIHRTDNRLATKLCERLGFKQKWINQEFVILNKKRTLWDLKH